MKPNSHGRVKECEVTETLKARFAPGAPQENLRR